MKQKVESISFLAVQSASCRTPTTSQRVLIAFWFSEVIHFVHVIPFSIYWASFWTSTGSSPYSAVFYLFLQLMNFVFGLIYFLDTDRSPVHNIGGWSGLSGTSYRLLNVTPTLQWNWCLTIDLTAYKSEHSSICHQFLFLFFLHNINYN